MANLEAMYVDWQIEGKSMGTKWKADKLYQRRCDIVSVGWKSA
jgi:hypothetical protein